MLNEFYVSNHTEHEIEIVMVPRFIEQVDLRAGDLVETVEQKMRASLDQTLPSVQEAGQVTFTLPARTTVFVGFSGGGQLPFDELRVSIDGQPRVLTRSNYRELFTIRDRLVGAVLHTLDIR